MASIPRDPAVTVGGQWVAFFRSLERVVGLRISARGSTAFTTYLQPMADEAFAYLTGERTLHEVDRAVFMEDDIEPVAAGLMAGTMRFYVEWVAETLRSADAASHGDLVHGGAAIARSMPDAVDLPRPVVRALHAVDGMLRAL
ncbi:MAG TPA: hypothetical protein VGO40_04820 [Longimicrobium sp.]|jgi:hypothetical protein|nr:hypothetical protein [Longimicrobium sp.]